MEPLEIENNSTETFNSIKPTIQTNLVPEALDPQRNLTELIQLNQSIMLSEEELNLLRSEPNSAENTIIQTINTAENAMRTLTQGKSGLVLGSGDNTPKWKSKGWQTLDIDPKSQADFIIDANHLNQVIPQQSLDFILAEYISICPLGRKGMSPAALLKRANETLKIGGILIVQSAHFENIPYAKAPDKNKYARLFTAHGFNVIIQSGEFYPDTLHGSDKISGCQKVTYYGTKVADGFDLSRVPGKLEMPQNDQLVRKLMEPKSLSRFLKELFH